MSNYNLPLQFDKSILFSTDLAGKNYVSGYPFMLQKIGAASYTATHSELSKVYNTAPFGIPTDTLYKPKLYVFMCKGPQCVYAAPGKAFYQGADIRVYDYVTGVIIKPVIEARVLSYDPRTGLLWFDAYSVLMGTGETNKFPIENARVSVFNAKYAISGTPYTPRSIASGGTAATKDVDALANLGSRNIKTVMQYFTDFISPAEGAFTHVDNTPTYINGYGLATILPSEHPGVIRQQVTSTLADRGRNFWIGPNTDQGKTQGICALGVGDTWEWMTYIPTLATAGNDYRLTMGAFIQTSAGVISQLEFLYSGSAQVKWQTVTRYVSGPVTTVSATNVATGWNKLSITNDGVNIVFKVNGATIASIGVGFIFSYGTVNFTMYFHHDLAWIAGAPPVIELDYFSIFRTYSTARGG